MATTNINVCVDSALKQEAETKAALSDYRTSQNTLTLFLFRTGTHSDLF